MAPVPGPAGLRELARLEENIAHRIRLTTFYHQELPGSASP